MHNFNLFFGLQKEGQGPKTLQEEQDVEMQVCNSFHVCLQEVLDILQVDAQRKQIKQQHLNSPLPTNEQHFN